MSPAEVAYRLQHKLREKHDEFTFAQKPLAIPPTDISLDALLDLSRHVNFAAYPHWQNEGLPCLLKQADQCLENTIDVFGLMHSFGKQVDWHLDPKTSKQWPKYSWSKVNIRDGFTYGGPKFVWEVNRLYGVPVLGLAFAATKKKEYADKVFSILSAWLSGNPYPYGVNWTSGIELGVRVANVIWGLSFLRGYELRAEQKEILNTFMYTHAQHLFRYPSKYSSNNNHAIAEAFGLFLIGVFFPDFENASQWRKFGQNVLERECLRQILPDGGSYEYSTTYLSFVFDFFLLFKIICDNRGLEYNQAIDLRLEKSCEYIYGLIDHGGNIPNIGDQDSAVLVNFGLDNHENFRSILNTGALLFGRSDFRQDNFPDIKTFILCGNPKHGVTVKNSVRKAASYFFKESGLSVIRKTVQGKDVVFVGNATPLGMPPLYAHGHLDALSFTLSIQGRAFLVDPGTYLYHSGGKWRRYFRSTAAHNTIQINGTDMTDMPGDFMFGKPYTITAHTLSEDDGCFIWQAGHTAYLNLECGVRHNRKVVLTKGEIVVEDMLVGVGKYSVEQFFHFHPDCQVTVIQKRVLVENDGICFEMDCAKEMNVRLFYGSEEPLAGWFSDAFNRLEKTNTVIVAGAIEGDVTLRTRLQVVE